VYSGPGSLLLFAGDRPARAVPDEIGTDAIRGDAMIDEELRGRGPGRAGRDHQTRVRLAARHAEHLYPGPLGRLVAHELTTYAERGHGLPSGGLAELVVREVLDRPAPRGRRSTHLRSGEFGARGGARR
jgi:hypothetical protein